MPYALVVDGEFFGLVGTSEVRRAMTSGLRVEVASFSPAKGWVPVCLDKFSFALAA